MNCIQLFFFTVTTFATLYAVHTNSLILSRQNTGVCWYSNCPGLPPLGHTAAHRCCLTAALRTDLLSPCSVPLRPFCDVHAEAKKRGDAGGACAWSLPSVWVALSPLSLSLLQRTTITLVTYHN